MIILGKKSLVAILLLNENVLTGMEVPLGRLSLECTGHSLRGNSSTRVEVPREQLALE